MNDFYDLGIVEVMNELEKSAEEGDELSKKLLEKVGMKVPNLKSIPKQLKEKAKEFGGKVKKYHTEAAKDVKGGVTALNPFQQYRNKEQRTERILKGLKGAGKLVASPAAAVGVAGAGVAMSKGKKDDKKE